MSCSSSVQSVPSVARAKERVKKAVAAVKGTSTKSKRAGSASPRERALAKVSSARSAYRSAMDAAHQKQAKLAEKQKQKKTSLKKK